MTKEAEFKIIDRLKCTKNSRLYKQLLNQIIDKYKEHIHIQAIIFEKKYREVLKDTMITIDDLEQQWVLWLIKAIRWFDTERWFWLWTYSTMFIRKEMVVYVEKNSTLFSLPWNSLNWNIFWYKNIECEDTCQIMDLQSKEFNISNWIFLKEMKQNIINECKQSEEVSDKDISYMKQILWFDNNDYNDFLDWCTNYITWKKVYLDWFRRNKEIILIIKRVMLKFLVAN